MCFRSIILRGGRLLLTSTVNNVPDITPNINNASMTGLLPIALDDQQ